LIDLTVLETERGISKFINETLFGFSPRRGDERPLTDRARQGVDLIQLTEALRGVVRCTRDAAIVSVLNSQGESASCFVVFLKDDTWKFRKKSSDKSSVVSNEKKSLSKRIPCKRIP
jgi:hypothetical protein